jgi:hypothetical protein
MVALIIGIALGLAIIGFIALLKDLDKHVIYGLILSAIGFLYVGFSWTDPTSLIACILQALLFLFIAYYGSKNRMLLLAGGYLLHGIWDLVFNQVTSLTLVPPHYDLFCLAVDFTIAFYLILLSYKNERSGRLQKPAEYLGAAS